MSDQYGFTPEAAGAPGPAQAQHQQGNGLAVAGMVLGIIGLVLCWFPFLGWILALLGVIFGAIGVSRAKKIGGKGQGMAIAGLALGVIGLLAGIGIFVYALRATSEFKELQEQRFREQERRFRESGQIEAPMPAPAIG